MKKYLALACLLITLGGCFSPAAKAPLKAMATALEDKNPVAFMQHVDMRRYATSQVYNLTQENEAMRALDNVGRLLGLGDMTKIMGTVMDKQRQEEAYFLEGISDGSLVAQCQVGKKTHCPWIPQALRDAEIKELSETTAVAHIITPNSASIWIALASKNDVWKVVGQAPQQATAIAYAQGTPPPMPLDTNKNPPPPITKDATVL